MDRAERGRGAPRTAPGVSSGDAGTVEVVYALPERQVVIELPLDSPGLTAREAVERCGLLGEFPELLAQTLVLGIFGAVCEPGRVLRPGDRVEIYRPLKHDPRTLRRERAASAPRKGRPR